MIRNCFVLFPMNYSFEIVKRCTLWRKLLKCAGAIQSAFNPGILLKKYIFLACKHVTVCLFCMSVEKKIINTACVTSSMKKKTVILKFLSFNIVLSLIYW